MPVCTCVLIVPEIVGQALPARDTGDVPAGTRRLLVSSEFRVLPVHIGSFRTQGAPDTEP